MADDTKQPWVEPAVEALTESDSRADVPDTAVRNDAIPGSAVLN